MKHPALPRLGTASWARTAAVGVSVLLVCWLVVARSTSAFSDTTDNEFNVLRAGTVALADDDGGSAMFQLTDLAPGPITPVRCIVVFYNGSIVGATDLEPVTLWADPPTTDLGPYLDLEIERSAVGGDCATFPSPVTLFGPGTLAGFTSTHDSAAAGLDTTWTPSAQGEQVAFRFTMALQGDDAAQGLSADWSFNWDVQTP